MLSEGNAQLSVRKLTLGEAQALAMDFQSIVGHADVAAVMAEQLQIDVAPNRVTASLEPGDKLLVGQHKGPRLPEGATKLPEGSVIDWLLLTVE